MATTVDHSIQPLPQHVIAQLRSSVTITSLADCIQQLLMNSLDASAANIDLSVNLIRNSITIQDDGDGILPADIALIGQRYATSKVPTPTSKSHTAFGYHGEALASMSTHCHFVLTSRHRKYRSTHTVRLHYGSLLHRGQISVDGQMLSNHGTTVTIDQLWGNMPVRLKARAAMGVDKEWNDIKRMIIELSLISQDVKIIVRDENGNKRLSIGNVKLGADLASDQSERDRYLRILGQTNASDISLASNWETIKASQEGLSVHGIMNMVPSASRTHQYLFINGMPVPYSKSSLLYSAVTMSFSSSNFGRILEENMSSSRNSSRTNIERHPSFILMITTNTPVHVEDVDYNKTGTLSDIISFLQYVVEEFLKLGGWKRKTTPWSSNGKVKGQNDESEASPVLLNDEQKKALYDFSSRTTMKPQAQSVMTNLSQWSRVKSSEPNISRHKFTITTKSHTLEDMPKLPNGIHDENVLKWTNPTTIRPSLVDSRTGNIRLESNSENPIDPLVKSRMALPIRPNKIVEPENVLKDKLYMRSTDILQGVDNPIFAATEERIPQLTSINHNIFNGAKRGHDNHQVMSFDKLSRASLRDARVIAQVDQKYILIKLPNALKNNVLVMVDQHAADERIRVEALWKGFFSSPSTQPMPIHKQIAFSPNKQEFALFTQHRSDFARWHITYSLDQNPPKLHVDSLPSVILDRCLEQPDLVISLLRTYIRELEDEDSGSASSKTHGSWISRMSKAPKILIEMINSKSCRSAIMFNDPLDINACKELVHRLAECDFPFQCAHGRPSMIPLVDLSTGFRDKETLVERKSIGLNSLKDFTNKTELVE